jgi:hypothetical protein
VSGYEIVRDSGSTTGSAGTPFIAFSEGLACPAGKKMLGVFASGFVIPGPNSTGSTLDAAYTDLFTTNDDLEQVTVEFTRGNGETFRDGDEARWRVEITCAAVS